MVPWLAKFVPVPVRIKVEPSNAAPVAIFIPVVPKLTIAVEPAVLKSSVTPVPILLPLPAFSTGFAPATFIRKVPPDARDRFRRLKFCGKS